jgi:hypothetical protein
MTAVASDGVVDAGGRPIRVGISACLSPGRSRSLMRIRTKSSPARCRDRPQDRTQECADGR